MCLDVDLNPQIYVRPHADLFKSKGKFKTSSLQAVNLNEVVQYRPGFILIHSPLAGNLGITKILQTE